MRIPSARNYLALRQHALPDSSPLPDADPRSLIRAYHMASKSHFPCQVIHDGQADACALVAGIAFDSRSVIRNDKHALKPFSLLGMYSDVLPGFRVADDILKQIIKKSAEPQHIHVPAQRLVAHLDLGFDSCLLPHGVPGRALSLTIRRTSVGSMLSRTLPLVSRL